MSLVRECDRCHDQTRSDRFDGWVNAHRTPFGGVIGSLPEFELCPTCARALSQWLAEPRPKAAQ